MSMQNMCLLVVLSTKLNILQITFTVTTPFPFASVSHITYHHWYKCSLAAVHQKLEAHPGANLGGNVLFIGEYTTWKVDG